MKSSDFVPSQPPGARKEQRGQWNMPRGFEALPVAGWAECPCDDLPGQADLCREGGG